MKYTSKNINIENLQENIKQKGYSDKVKKYLSSFLLVAQVMSVAPNIAQAHDVRAETQNSVQEVLNQDNKKYINFGYVDIDGNPKEIKIDISNTYNATIEMDYADIDGNKSNFNLKIDNSDRAVNDYGNKDEIDRNNTDEFASRNIENLKNKLE